MVTFSNSINSTVGASISGATNTLTVTNPSNTASSQAQELITVGGSSSGDVWTQYSIGSTQSYSIGIDNSDSDILKITQAASGTVNPSTATVLQQFDTSNTRAYFPIPLMALGGATQAIGSTVDYNILNTSTTAASDARINVQVSNTGGGNAYITWTGPANNWYAGVNKTVDSNAWELQQNTSSIFPSATIVMKATTGGNITMPGTSCFLAYKSSSTTNATGDGTLYTIIFDTVVTDQNSNYNNSTGTFTAPVTGIYEFGTSVSLINLAAGHNSGLLNITGTSFTNRVANNNAGGTRDGGTGALTYNGSTFLNMTAGNTCTIVVQVSGSTKTVTVQGAAALVTAFWGKLVC